jgi:hypothetical protein
LPRNRDTFSRKSGHGIGRHWKRSEVRIVIEIDERRISLAGPAIPTGQSSQLTEKTLESLTLGIRKGAIFRSAFELELDEEIEFAGGKRSSFDRAAEKVSQEGGMLERFPGGFGGVHFPRIVGPGRLQGRPGFPGGPLEHRTAHVAGNGEREIAVALR